MTSNGPRSLDGSAAPRVRSRRGGDVEAAREGVGESGEQVGLVVHAEDPGAIHGGSGTKAAGRGRRATRRRPGGRGGWRRRRGRRGPRPGARPRRGGGRRRRRACGGGPRAPGGRRRSGRGSPRATPARPPRGPGRTGTRSRGSIGVRRRAGARGSASRPASWRRAAVAAGSAPASSGARMRRHPRRGVGRAAAAAPGRRPSPAAATRAASGSRVRGDLAEQARAHRARGQSRSPVTGRGRAERGRAHELQHPGRERHVALAPPPRRPAPAASGSSGSCVQRLEGGGGDPGRDRSAPRAARRAGAGKGPWISWIPASSEAERLGVAGLEEVPVGHRQGARDGCGVGPAGEQDARGGRPAIRGPVRGIRPRRRPASAGRSPPRRRARGPAPPARPRRPLAVRVDQRCRSGRSTFLSPGRPTRRRRRGGCGTPARSSCSLRGDGGCRIRKVVPAPGADSKVIVPPCASTMLRAMASPCPEPRPTSLVVKKGSKTLSRTSAGMPGPVSEMEITTASPSAAVRTRMVPARVGAAGPRPRWRGRR